MRPRGACMSIEPSTGGTLKPLLLCLPFGLPTSAERSNPASGLRLPPGRDPSIFGSNNELNLVLQQE